MCTVTLNYQGNSSFVLTSNRDESPNRSALSPNFYNINKTKVLLPKDELSGGSWIGVSDKNRVVCLLNGAFILHKRQSAYKQSRGVVVNDLLVANDIKDAIENYDLNNIEPFTIVIADWNTSLNFYELVWDGSQKHFKELTLDTHIWSSSTLYTEDQKSERINWFKAFKAENKWSSNTALEFHKTAGKNNIDYGVVMDRGFVKTTSITQVEKKQSKISMYFESLQNNQSTKTAFESSSLINE